MRNSVHATAVMLLFGVWLLAGCGKDARAPVLLSVESIAPTAKDAKAKPLDGVAQHNDGSVADELVRRPSDASLAIRIELDGADSTPTIGVDQPFRVILTNNSDRPIRIWQPRGEQGYYQCSFLFTNLSSGEQVTIRKRVLDLKSHWSQVRDDYGLEFDDWYAEFAVVEIAPGDYFPIQVGFGDYFEGEQAWTPLPCPNTDDRFSVLAQFETIESVYSTDRHIWNGTISSAPIKVSLVAPSWKTPHDYLRHGYPAKAIELMAADPKWIRTVDDNWWTPLHWAARKGHVAAVQWLLDHGADINKIAPNAFTPLHLADDLEVISLILQKQPDWSKMWQTPLQRAAAKLVDQHDEKGKEKWRRIVDLYLKSGMDYDLLTAIHLDDRERVTAILQQSPQLADNVQGQSPLRTAASLGRLKICQDLIEHFPVDVNDFDRGWGYPIIKSALAFPLIVKLLIDHGADLQTRITFHGFKTGFWLIDGEATALHHAADDGVPETITLLIDNGIDIFAKAKGCVQTALESAVMSGKADNVRAIVQHPKFRTAPPELRQAELNKSLFAAVNNMGIGERNQRLELVRVLLDHGANPNISEDGRTAIQAAACEMGSEQSSVARQIVTLLMERGGSLDFFSAIAIGDLEQVQRWLELDPRSVNQRRWDGYPALSIAASMNYMEIVAALLKAGGDVNIRNQSPDHGYLGETPLHCAVSYHRYEMTRLLLDAGANVNALDDRKNTPLHEWGGAKVTRLLLERGARLDSRDAGGDTLLDWARKMQWGDTADIEKLFREFGERKGN